MGEWLSLHSGGTGEIEEKKSRFIATIEPVSSEDEAVAFVTAMKKKYWDARHNCSAFIIGENGDRTRCSDDGEPSGTAGRPMLDVLAAGHVTNACVVVTRYFGGTLLGTGGLVRAYSAAVKKALENCTVINRIQGFIVRTECDYNDFEKIRRMISAKGLDTVSVEYAQSVLAQFAVEDAAKLTADITDITSGRARISDPEPAVYAVIDGKVTIF